ncbi:MAG: AAA family ATPase [Dehalococcoidia bacterium]|nr:AAA family ATPase [Dehalococcoidia bacterium]
MFLSRIKVRNFRNFRDLDIELGTTSVVVGENGVGKSNLLFALRLVLDPRLSDSSRYLREEDFWQGLNEPIKNGETIEVTVELQDFKNDKNLFAVLQQFCVPGPVPDTARLTYLFRPKSALLEDRGIHVTDYEFLVFGGADEADRVDFRVRRWIPIEVLPALRDAERDLANWRQSPLRPLIESLSIPDTTLATVAAGIDKATGQLLAVKDVQDLTTLIDTRLTEMVGSVLEIDPSLGFAPTMPERLTRALRMFGDGSRQRSVSELSLGADNILYLLLLAIELERKEATAERAATILAIEEPEAHLHPHLQRLVFRDFLRRKAPVLLTTHSPHIASVAPLKSVVLLKSDRVDNDTKGWSTVGAGLTEQDIVDLERYLDTTRAEVLFARGVILVEGPAELFLVPAVAEDMNTVLDEHGVTVCSVHGTDFAPYAKLLGQGGLNIPFVILTDGDWYTNRKGEELSRGLRRTVTIAKALNHADSDYFSDMYRERRWDDLKEAGQGIGIFVGEHTLEVDLFDDGHGQEVVDSLKELGIVGAREKELRRLAAMDENLSRKEANYVLRSIERWGKGRVAQRLVGRVAAEKFPTYITDGVLRIIEVLQQ